MPRILQSRKGISPILATLLLIVIAVAAIVITYAWVMTFLGAQTQAGGTMLAMENVNWTPTATNIVIKNIGTSDATIVRFYVGETDGNLTLVTADTNLGAGKLLPVGGTVTIVLSWPNTWGAAWTVDQTYYFKVAPEAGTEIQFQDTPRP